MEIDRIVTGISYSRAVAAIVLSFCQTIFISLVFISLAVGLRLPVDKCIPRADNIKKAVVHNVYSCVEKKKQTNASVLSIYQRICHICNVQYAQAVRFRKNSLGIASCGYTGRPEGRIQEFRGIWYSQNVSRVSAVSPSSLILL